MYIIYKLVDFPGNIEKRLMIFYFIAMVSNYENLKGVPLCYLLYLYIKTKRKLSYLKHKLYSFI